jgi:hypothetical protein
MDILKILAFAASLAAFGLAPAHAAQERGSYLFPMDPGDPGQTDHTWTLDASMLDEPMKRGDTFFDLFEFKLPDEEIITFGFTSTRSVPGGFGVKFADYGLFLVADDSPIDIADAPPFSISAGEYDLQPGTYAIVVEGTYRKDGGTYSGFIEGVPAVPEPAGWAMMLAGIGVMGAIMRRR